MNVWVCCLRKALGHLVNTTSSGQQEKHRQHNHESEFLSSVEERIQLPHERPGGDFGELGLILPICSASSTAFCRT